MTSTSGLKQGDLFNEVLRLRSLLTLQRRRARQMETSRAMWRERARAAEWANRRAA